MQAIQVEKNSAKRENAGIRMHKALRESTRLNSLALDNANKN
jgi:hypothetical protein